MFRDIHLVDIFPKIRWIVILVRDLDLDGDVAWPRGVTRVTGDDYDVIVVNRLSVEGLEDDQTEVPGTVQFLLIAQLEHAGVVWVELIAGEQMVNRVQGWKTDSEWS